MHTPGPWKIAGANVFRVVASEVPHQNKPSGLCPPYPWAIVAETNPDSVGGSEAAANARLIAIAPELLALVRCIAESNGDDTLNEIRAFNYDAPGCEYVLGHKYIQLAAIAAIAKAEGKE